jgi:hypothetical protein
VKIGLLPGAHQIGLLPDALDPGFHYALDPGFHGAAAGPARTDRDADDAGVP